MFTYTPAVGLPVKVVVADERRVCLISLSLSLAHSEVATVRITLITCLASIHRTASSSATNSTKANPLLAPTLEWRPQQISNGGLTNVAMADDGGMGGTREHSIDRAGAPSHGIDIEHHPYMLHLRCGD